MKPAVLIILFLYCKTDIDAASSNTTLLPSTRNITSSTSMIDHSFSTEGMMLTTYTTTEHPGSGKTSFVINPTTTTSNDQMTITSSSLITMSVAPSISINTKTNTTKNNEDPTTETKKALYWGIGGGVGTLALISIGILVRGCFSKYKSQRRVDNSSEHTSDMPLGDCPSWRHVNVKHPLSSRITERTEHSSSY